MPPSRPAASRSLRQRPSAYEIASPITVPTSAMTKTSASEPPSSAVYAPARNIRITPGKTTPTPTVASASAEKNTDRHAEAQEQ